jgi:hypothetical protein
MIEHSAAIEVHLVAPPENPFRSHQSTFGLVGCFQLRHHEREDGKPVVSARE